MASNASDTTPRLNLPYILPSQAQKHVTHNEAIDRLDALAHPVFVSRSIATPPSDSDPWALFLVPDGATGSWADKSGSIAIAEGETWAFLAPVAGYRAFVADEMVFVHFDGTAWTVNAAATNIEAASIAVNTAPDPSARMTVGADTVIFSHDAATPGTGDIRLKANKAAEAGTASVLFQTDWEGRAEVGLCANDNLGVKVSADGAAWALALEASADGTLRAPQRITVGEPGHGGALTVHVPFPQLTLRDVEGVGNAHTGFVNWVDGDGVERVWCGLGSTGNSRFTFLSTYEDGLCFQTYGGEYPIEFRQGVDQVVRMRVHTNGYVGIQQTAPTAPLHVGGAVRLGSASASEMPSASDLGAGAVLYVPDDAGGATLAFSDGTDWRRAQDRAVVA